MSNIDLILKVKQNIEIGLFWIASSKYHIRFSIERQFGPQNLQTMGKTDLVSKVKQSIEIGLFQVTDSEYHIRCSIGFQVRSPNLQNVTLFQKNSRLEI